jgi:hypothetical protein
MLRSLAVLFLMISTPALASEPEVDDDATIINADYSVASPVGELRSSTAGNSTQGLGFEMRIHASETLKIGFATSWQVFREHKSAPGTQSGAQYERHTASLVPVLATANYIWHHGAMRTFVGMGGGMMMSRRTLAALAEETVDTTWYIAASGLAGAVYELTAGFGLEGKMRYVGGYKDGYKPLGMVQMTLGFVFFF